MTTRRRDRRGLFAAVCLSVLLVAALAGPAAAHHKAGHQQGASGAQGSDSAGGGGDAGSSHQGNAKAEISPAKQGQAAGSGNGLASAPGAASQGNAKGTVETLTEEGTGRNPGHVKIDGVPFSIFPPRNEPHVGCTFQLQFFGFDAEKTATWALLLHAPTQGGPLSSGEVTFTETRKGKELNEAVNVDLSGPLATSGVAPHPKQGSHVRLNVVTPDGPKHKVFWVRCSNEQGELAILPVTEEIPDTNSDTEPVVDRPSEPDQVLGGPPLRSGDPPTQVLGTPGVPRTLAATGLDLRLFAALSLMLLMLGAGVRTAEWVINRPA